jgi:SAM-dependent methyltransferase
VLEVGAGHGTFTSLLAEVGAVTALEPGERMGDLLRGLYGEDTRVEVQVGVVDDLPTGERFGSAVMINVLEHIADDAAALRSIHDRLLPGGHLVVWVPAFQSLYSRFDELLGHERRYRLKGLRSLVESCDYTVVDARYVNAVGWFSWLVVARMLGKIPTSSATVGLFDKAVVPVVRGVERGVRPPFGQSILLAARKPVGAPVPGS